MNRATYPHTTQPSVHKKQYDTHTVWAFENDWHSSFCSCKPMGRCCLSCFCSCCIGCKLANHLGEISVIGCFPCSLCYLRTKLRTARRIEGSCCGDFCTSFPLCMACTQTQMSNELESQGMWDIPKVQKSKHAQNDRSNHYNDHH